MIRVKTSLSFLALLLLCGAEASRADDIRRPGVGGRVVGESSPLRAAGVYAYQLADSSLHKAVTDQQGQFLFHSLPAGLYKIIAHKPGFTPVVVLLTRNTAQAYQFVELQLAEQEAAGRRQPGDDDDFWAIRARIPSDVLREIEHDARGSNGATGDDVLAALLPPAGLDGPGGSFARLDELPAQFQAEMQAMTGVDQIAGGEGMVSSGRVGLVGQLGQTRVNLNGRFQQLAPGGGAFGGDTAAVADGQTQALTLDLERGDGRLLVASLNNRLAGGEAGPIDFEQYRVSWSQPFGEDSRSDFTAQYTEESNFHRQDSADPIDIPAASRTWRVEGSYTTSFGSRGTLQTGLRYREREFGLGGAAQPLQLVPEPQSNLDLFGRGGVRLDPAVLLEYGLYTTLSDGSLAVTPQGGLVLQIGRSWQLSGAMSRRVHEERQDDYRVDFLPVLYQESDLCQEGSQSCYQVRLAFQGEGAESEDSAFSIDAVHRTVGETLRLYFSDDFFDRFESLYLVPGDEIPEFRMSLSRKIAPQVLATLASSLASGGGGMFLTRDQVPFENSVQYLVTSLDTQFRGTSTGVFLAFHHLSQELQPVGQLGTPDRPILAASSQTDLERLQLLLTQDLNVLLNLAADWAVQLNMEVSRAASHRDLPGSTGAEDSELRKRFLGGIAVRF